MELLHTPTVQEKVTVGAGHSFNLPTPPLTSTEDLFVNSPAIIHQTMGLPEICSKDSPVRNPAAMMELILQDLGVESVSQASLSPLEKTPELPEGIPEICLKGSPVKDPTELMELILKDLGIEITPVQNSQILPTPVSSGRLSSLSDCDVTAVSSIPSSGRLTVTASTPPNDLQVITPSDPRSPSPAVRPAYRDCKQSTAKRVPGHKRRRYTARVSKAQRVILKGAFTRARQPTYSDIAEISAVSGLNGYSIMEWFAKETLLTGMKKRLFSDDIAPPKLLKRSGVACRTT
ncbi:uncharacterized protein [Apostichopus japonicus]|uniref:uncharacterized protein n=1 Tax=Stichopus japonicus TaxID=307972 RepID=UPI003AB2A521